MLTGLGAQQVSGGGIRKVTELICRRQSGVKGPVWAQSETADIKRSAAQQLGSIYDHFACRLNDCNNPADRKALNA